MKDSSPHPKCVLITHVVNPHQFYFKYESDIVNSEFSKFDFEIQLYGNDLHAQKIYENGYSPAENELVIFFNLIFNKWIRGRVVSVGQEIVFWCIDNGIWEKCTEPHVLPLTERFHEDMKLVHLGGLSLLPTEKTLNIETVEVETHLSRQWDEKSINTFKEILKKSKTFMFTKEFELVNHKFGSLSIETKMCAKKDINEVLLAMPNVAHFNQYSEEAIWPYILESRLELQLYQSITNNLSIQTTTKNNNSSKMRTAHHSSIKSDSEISSVENLSRSEDFDDSVSSRSFSDISTTQGAETPAISHLSERLSQVMRSESPKSTVSSSTTETSKCHDVNDSSKSEPSPTSTVKIKSPSSPDYLSEECYLRTFKTNFSKNVRQQPLNSTMDWINSMCKSNSSDTTSQSYESCEGSANNDNANDNDRQPTSPPSSTKNVPYTSLTRRREELATLAQKESALKSIKIVNISSNTDNRLFGVPAGYAKNCLDTFGGLNKI